MTEEPATPGGGPRRNQPASAGFLRNLDGAVLLLSELDHVGLHVDGGDAQRQRQGRLRRRVRRNARAL